MLDNLKIILSAIVGIVFVGLLMYNNALKKNIERQDMQIESLSIQLQQQNEAVKNLVIAQEEKQKKIAAAQDDAKKMREQFDQKLKMIMAQKVSQDCGQAMDWMIRQGGRVFECTPYNEG